MIKRFLSLGISLVFLFILYSKISVSETFHLLATLNIPLFALSLALIIPVIYIMSLRLYWLLPQKEDIPFKPMVTLILLANVLNLLLPAKLGDITKAYFLKTQHQVKGRISLAVVLIEKAGDMLGLCFVCLIGLLLWGDYSRFNLSAMAFVLTIIVCGLFVLFSRRLGFIAFFCLQTVLPQRVVHWIRPLFLGWTSTHRYIHSKKTIVPSLLLISVINSLVHFFGIWVMFLSVAPQLPFLQHLALTPLSILASLIPLTFSGIGIRDMAVVSLYESTLAPEISATLGMLLTIRLIGFAIPGIPFIKRFFQKNQSPP